MNTKQLATVSLLVACMFVAYTLFSSVLYLEVITFTTVLIACLFPLKLSMMASFCFGLLHIVLNGVFPWTVMFIAIFPLYSFLGYTLRHQLIHNGVLTILIGFLFSFLIGQLVDLPFLLFSGKITVLYIIMGLKTSLLQGLMSAFLYAFLFEKVYVRIDKALKGKIK